MDNLDRNKKCSIQRDCGEKSLDYLKRHLDLEIAPGGCDQNLDLFNDKIRKILFKKNKIYSIQILLRSGNMVGYMEHPAGFHIIPVSDKFKERYFRVPSLNK